VVGANCSLPSAAGGALACAVELTNSGNVRLQSGVVTGAGSAITSNCTFGVLVPGAKFICQAEQAVSQADLNSADDDSAYAVSIGVSGLATPMGSNSSDVTSGDAEPVALAAALRPSVNLDSVSASPTTVTTAGETLNLQQFGAYRRIVLFNAAHYASALSSGFGQLESAAQK
jgi:hypothetical protein